jgi:hypothetical protein
MCVYDNLRSAVARRDGDRVTWNQRFLALRGHYAFSRSSPTASSRWISSPTTKKKKTIGPSLSPVAQVLADGVAADRHGQHRAPQILVRAGGRRARPEQRHRRRSEEQHRAARLGVQEQLNGHAKGDASTPRSWLITARRRR